MDPLPMAVLNPNSGEVMLNMKQIVEDNSALSRRINNRSADFDGAWESYRLSVATDAQTVKHLATLGIVSAGQTGVTENQQSVTPIRTGTGDAIAGTLGVSADAIAASLGNLATSLVPVIASSLATAISTAIAALLPVVVTASGGASTPSQTQAKPTGATS